MKKTSFKILCAALATLMILSTFAACKNKNQDETTASTEAPATESQGTNAPEESTTKGDSGDVTETTPGGNTGTTPGGDETTAPGGDETTAPGGDDTTAPGGDETTAPGGEVTTAPGGETTEESQTPVVKDPTYGDLIELSNDLKNGVNPYFTDATKEQLTIENQNMTLGYGMVGMSGNSQVQHLSNKNGATYIENTMDIVLNMKNGKKYYASQSLEGSILNIYRYGYYFYETRIEGQTFKNQIIKEDALDYDLSKFASSDVGGAKFNADTGILYFRNTSAVDPKVVFSEFTFNPAEYQYLEFTMKVTTGATCTVYFRTTSGKYVNYNFESVANGEFVTYTVPLQEVSGLKETVDQVRLDINGPNRNEVEISDIVVYNASFDGAPEGLTLQRTFFTYSNKLHHLVQLSTTETVDEIASIDMVTTINADTVAAIIVKDKGGIKYTLDGVDWASVEYVGFDIKDTGIFGFILPVYDDTVYKNLRHEGVGSLSVTLEGGVYTVTQSKAPQDGKLVASANYTLNANDFFMGIRVYNDESHTFDEFVKQAVIERNPLTNENITVDTGHDHAEYVAYDPIRGAYVFTLTGSTFQKSYHIHQNRQYRVIINIKGDALDRQMYFMTRMSDTGSLECAALLGEGDMLLPVPLEVAKNFGGDGENTIYNLDDAKYSETYFPMVIKAGENRQYTVVHGFQNWGIFPLKQISSIQYYTPFYHLSTGVTETNCIVPFADAGPSLPDHRAMSAPFWASQPQHTSGGSHVFLHYANEEGKTQISTTTYALIDSYGPTYADINLGYVSADGRVEANYTHMEFPQTDENRAFYELSYEFKEDVSFTDFAHQFKFYRCTDNNETGWYKRIGYLDVNNQPQVTNTAFGGTQDIILGDNAPYFTFFDMEDYVASSATHVGYVNISFLIKDATIICNGEEITPNFFITNYMMGDNSYLGLSLNLGEVTFKKGDTIKINAIIMPWGSHLLDDGKEDFANGDYEYTSVIGHDENGDPIYYMDKNVRDVREDSILNPFTATATKDAKILDSVWLPKIKTTNGQTAEFTVQGGNNNCVVRVYGFDKLTAPVIEEYVNGKWSTYRVASASKRDARGFGYFYDGYMVHYDEDGTYSYSFVINMDNGAERKFRISAVDDFKAWPKVQYDPNANNITTEGDPLNVYVDGKELVSFKDDMMAYLNDLILVEDEEEFAFARYYPIAGIQEVILHPFQLEHDAYNKLESTGQYAVIKYRIPADAVSHLENMQFFASTVNSSPKNNDENFVYYDLKHDGEWHVLIFDLSQMVQKASVHFQPDEKGNYMAQYFRIDLFNRPVEDGMYMDLAYVGLCDNLEEIFELNKDMAEVTVVTKSGSDRIDPSTGAPVNNSPLNVYIPHDKIYAAAKNLSLSKVEMMNENGLDFVRLSAMVNSKYEAFATLFTMDNPQFANLESTGQYVVIKYRIQGDSTVKLSALEVFTNTFDTNVAYDNGKANTDYYMLNHDGEWHVVVLDVSKMLSNYVKADEATGTYLLKVLRVDFFSKEIAADIYVDYAYIGIADDLSKICEFAANEKEIVLVTAEDKETRIDPKTGEPFPYNTTPFNVFIGPDKFYNIASKNAGHFSPITDEGGFTRATGLRAGKGEAYANFFSASDAEYANITATGQYIVFKYRLPAAAKNDVLYLQFYTATESTSAKSSIAFMNVVYDDQWHVVIIDASKLMPDAEVKANANNEYMLQFLRFDFINGSSLPEGFYIDYEYLAICDDLSKAYEYNKDMESVLLYEGADKITHIDPKTGEAITDPNPTPDPDPEPDPVPESQWRINVNKLYNNGTQINNFSSTNTPYVLDLNKTEFQTASSLGVNGWFMAESGVAEYKYRIIGETTVEKSFGKGGSKAPSADGGAYMNIANGLGLDESALNGVTFNGDKYFDLTGFEGQKVTVEFIAVTNDGREIVGAIFNNVNVPTANS